MQNDKTPTTGKAKRPRRKLAKEIKRMLSAGKSVLEITSLLECHPSAVYWHKAHLAGKKRRDSLDDKIKRFNRKGIGILEREFVVAATEMRCAFSGRLLVAQGPQADGRLIAETDSFCLGVDSGVPILYLPEYRLLAKIGLEEHEKRCLAVLERRGWTCTKVG